MSKCIYLVGTIARWRLLANKYLCLQDSPQKTIVIPSLRLIEKTHSFSGVGKTCCEQCPQFLFILVLEIGSGDDRRSAKVLIRWTFPRELQTDIGLWTLEVNHVDFVHTSK